MLSYKIKPFLFLFLLMDSFLLTSLKMYHQKVNVSSIDAGDSEFLTTLQYCGWLFLCAKTPCLLVDGTHIILAGVSGFCFMCAKHSSKVLSAQPLLCREIFSTS